MAHPHVPASPTRAPFELPAWKSVLGTVSSVVLALLFLVAGLWKITDPMAASVRMTQALLPAALSLPIAISAGIVETFAALMLLVPRFRRWGAWLAGLMLVAFLVYFAINYNALRGAECNCFPWIKRAVGPAFFIGDGVMLLLAVIAGWWAAPSQGRRPAIIMLGAVAVFSAASFGIQAARTSGLKAPAAVTVNNQSYSLQTGRVFVYFFDPQCSHCWEAAQDISKYKWNDVRVLAIPTATPQYTAQFLAETGLKADVSNDVKILRDTFKFTDAPYAVLLEKGHQKIAFTNFDKTEPAKTLRESGYIQ